jgi:hypothetical protein
MTKSRSSCATERRERLTSEVGPDGSGSKPGMEPWTHIPEKSGRDAALSLPLLAGATVGATACPKAGVAAAAAGNDLSNDHVRQQASHPSDDKIDIGSKRAKTCFLAKPARRTRPDGKQVLDA